MKELPNKREVECCASCKFRTIGYSGNSFCKINDFIVVEDYEVCDGYEKSVDNIKGR